MAVQVEVGLGKFSQALLDLDAPRPADVPEGKQFYPWRIKIMTPEEFLALSQSTDRLSDVQLAYLAGFGMLAPTSHNTQPQRWGFMPDDNALLVYADRQAILPFSDKVGRQATISLGCAIGNVGIAARCFGLTPTLEVLEENPRNLYPYAKGEDRYIPVAKIHFQLGGVKPEDAAWLRAMTERKVVRAQGDSTVHLPSQITEQLQTRINAYPGLNLHIITNPITKLGLAKYQESADSKVLKTPKFAVELGDWFHPNDSTSYVGMRGIEFGRNDKAALRYSEGLKHPDDPEKQLRADDINGFAAMSKLHVNTASAVGVITATQDNPAIRLAAGQAFAELTLLLHQLGYSTSVRAALTEVDLKTYGFPGVVMLQAVLKTTDRPEVLFTIGKPKDDQDGLRPHSARMSIEATIYPAAT